MLEFFAGSYETYRKDFQYREGLNHGPILVQVKKTEFVKLNFAKSDYTMSDDTR